MFAQHSLLRYGRRIAAAAALAGLALASFAGAGPIKSAAAAAPAIPSKLTSDELLVGGHFAPASDWYMSGQQAEINAAEDSFGRTFDLVQSYYQFEMPFPTWRESWNLEKGRTPVIAWNGIRDAASVGAGAYDAMIRTRARGVAALGGPVVMRFAWEMDGAFNPFKPNTVAGYISEWRRVHQLFAEEGATNVVWMWCPNAWAFDTGQAPQYYPGDDVVDWVGADGYDFAPVKVRSSHQSFESIFANSHAWAKSHNKPFAIGEFGALEDGPTYKADWYDAARRSLTGALAGTKAVINWSNRDGTYDDPYTFYNYRYDTTPASVAAWARWSTATNRPPPVPPVTVPPVTVPPVTVPPVTVPPVTVPPVTVPPVTVPPVPPVWIRPVTATGVRRAGCGRPAAAARCRPRSAPRTWARWDRHPAR